MKCTTATAPPLWHLVVSSCDSFPIASKMRSAVSRCSYCGQRRSLGQPRGPLVGRDQCLKERGPVPQKFYHRDDVCLTRCRQALHHIFSPQWPIRIDSGPQIGGWMGERCFDATHNSPNGDEKYKHDQRLFMETNSCLALPLNLTVIRRSCHTVPRIRQ
ncbi:hypothetical protein EX30DRAFT_71499 [Ascodesmis nigricans]|uniref:Uncharacterized protein n=1 Tax=Ascodesmis nigricans TaxID=341454 RepID=A0A4S2MTS5_9PEZI|nr:hypothetical protein EX30DRAFT_71499 [Ascodesmis nigricans]